MTQEKLIRMEDEEVEAEAEWMSYILLASVRQSTIIEIEQMSERQKKLGYCISVDSVKGTNLDLQDTESGTLAWC